MQSGAGHILLDAMVGSHVGGTRKTQPRVGIEKQNKRLVNVPMLGKQGTGMVPKGRNLLGRRRGGGSVTSKKRT